MLDPDRYKPTKPFKGMWLFLASKRRYVNAAIEHGYWLDLQAPDLRKRYLEGKYDPDSQNYRTLESNRYDSLRQQFWASLMQVSIVALIALGVGASVGTIDISLSLNPSRTSAFIGTLLIAWAALFELGGPGLASWDGQTLSETVHPRIFQVLFVPGTLGLLCSAVI